ncbi:MAG: acetamidase [Verrucomicrobiae bacterium]|nr:acetamidase [Verrucomicrobiae bacterium]
MAVHRFHPSHYHITIGSHSPVLRIASGDTVITTTVDARGRDVTGKKVTPSGHPQTGPFYVDGAEPGDALAVHLDHLWPNRDAGWSCSTIASNVVDPWFAAKLPKAPMSEWRIDRKRGTATLLKPKTKLGRLKLPLDPMLGCFGVAPEDGQAISCGTSGQYGGNMDYRGFRKGVTVYFPVFVKGALLHVGDGHAVQGDGEIVGTGIETSFDVKFSVRVLKRKRIHWPRGETKCVFQKSVRCTDFSRLHHRTPADSD